MEKQIGLFPEQEKETFQYQFQEYEPMLSLLSWGGGQDSTAIGYKLAYDQDFRKRYAPNDLLVLMSDTGNEHPETYEHTERMKTFFKEHDIEFQVITSDMGFHTGDWTGLTDFYEAKDCIGSVAFPATCSIRLKQDPIYRFLENYVSKKYGMPLGRKRGLKAFAMLHQPIRVLIGFAAGEEKRIADPATFPKWKKESVCVTYPLIDLGMDRAACQQYIFNLGHVVPLPSSCMCCHYQSGPELIWLERHYPEVFKKWVVLEQAKLEKNQHKGKKNLGVSGTQKTLVETLENAKEKFCDMTDAELNEYKMSHGHCIKSRY